MPTLQSRDEYRVGPFLWSTSIATIALTESTVASGISFEAWPVQR